MNDEIEVLPDDWRDYVYDYSDPLRYNYYGIFWLSGRDVVNGIGKHTYRCSMSIKEFKSRIMNTEFVPVGIPEQSNLED